MNNPRLEHLRAWGYHDNMLLVDVSRWQGDINWDVMKSRGVKAAIIRCTVGDYYADPMSKLYTQSILKRGIYGSDYHVMRTEATAQDQIDWYYKHQPRRPDFPICLDLEWEKIADNTVFYDPERTTERFLQCAELIKSRDGRTPFLYSAPGYLDWWVKVKKLLHFPLWIAHFGVNFPGQYWIESQEKYGNMLEEMGFNKWEIWQCLADADNQGEYFGSGAHGLDVNFYNGTLKEFEKKHINKIAKIRCRIRSISRWLRNKYNRQTR